MDTFIYDFVSSLIVRHGQTSHALKSYRDFPFILSLLFHLSLSILSANEGHEKYLKVLPFFWGFIPLPDVEVRTNFSL